MTTTLLSTVNQPAIERRIRRAFREWWATRTGNRRPAFDAVFEHGHWWVTVCDPPHQDYGTDHAYDVVDAEGGDSVDGFSFEEV